MAKIAVTEIEYVEGGKAIWVHGPKGDTPLRITCTGAVKVVTVDGYLDAPTIDLNVTGNITILKGKPRKKLAIK